MSKNKTPKNRLRRAYAEILRGCSTHKYERFGVIHLKHLSVWDTEALDEKRSLYFEKATEKGLPSTKEKLKLLEKDGLWDPSKDKEVKELERFIERMSQTKSKLILKSEIERVSEEIKSNQKKLEEINTEKNQLVGLTSELFADKKVNDYYVYLTLYKDSTFKEPFFTKEEFDELSDVELAELIIGYNTISDVFSDINLQRIALSSYFLNNYYLCKDNPFTFFGKPIVELTYHQIDLFSYGRYFKHVLSEMKNPPSPDAMEDPDKLLELYNIEQNKEKLDQGKDQTGVASTVVGATKDDLEALGMSKESAEGNVVDLNEEIAKKGGTLSMEDLIKLHGV